MQSISPNYNRVNGVKQIRLLKKICHKSCILCQLLTTKTLASGSKCIEHFFYFYHSLPYICWEDVIYFTCHVFLNSLDILCFNPLNLKNKIIKIERKKIFCVPSKNFEKYFMAHQYMPKIFHGPHKNSPAPSPTYLMYGPWISLISLLSRKCKSM